MLSRLMQILGFRMPNKKVNDVKDWYTSESGQVQVQAKQLQRKIEKNEIKLQTTAYRVGVATGRIQ